MADNDGRWNGLCQIQGAIEHQQVETVSADAQARDEAQPSCTSASDWFIQSFRISCSPLPMNNCSVTCFGISL